MQRAKVIHLCLLSCAATVAIEVVSTEMAANAPTPAAQTRGAKATVPRWGIFEASFTSTSSSDNPIHDTQLVVTFSAPSKRTHIARGFWDGGAAWKVRFSPDEIGEWTFSTSAIPGSDRGLHGQSGAFRVGAATGVTKLERHGPIRVSKNRRFLEHADGTPFFWLADTGWNAALLSTAEEFKHYAAERARQRFTAVQWVTTQWRASPQGDRLNQPAFTGNERIAINPAFFQRLDDKMAELNRAGLVSVPVLLWAIGGGSDPKVNPGVSLPEDQAILLARYMVARWQAHDVIWILPGDGDYRGERAEKWKRIGRGVFGDAPHAPVILHPGGMHWVLKEFLAETWLDIHGYQSGHGDDDKTLRWMTEGPPAKDWPTEPARPFINLEPPYEHHIAYQSKQPIPPLVVRRAVYWSLLNVPTAGVTYGGHGVWGWDDGTKTPTDHAGTGIPFHWKKAIVMPAAEQMAHVAALFTSIDFWRLRPAPDVLAQQPGTAATTQFITAAASESRDLVVAYTPEARTITVVDKVAAGRAAWHNPRTGARTAATGQHGNGGVQFETPEPGDWVLVVRR